jgi:hypothetical protein
MTLHLYMRVLRKTFHAFFTKRQKNRRYPYGMKWLAGGIHQLGLKPGIWIADLGLSLLDCGRHAH